MTLPDLIERLGAATGADREIDALIAIVLRDGADGHKSFPLGTFSPGRVQADMGRLGWSVAWTVPAYTASVDAALALCGRVLPGWCPAIRQDPRPAFEGLWHAFVMRKPDGRTQHAAWGSTPALALILAMLKALDAKQGGSALKSQGGER